MYKIQTLNQISVAGLEQFPRDQYEIASEINAPDAILVRSQKVGLSDSTEGLVSIARAGAGVNNIAVSDFTERGVVVFNTPGANANAVKELVLSALLIGSRGILQGIQYVNSLEIKDATEMNKVLEKEKKRFKGEEITGKTLGVIGLGNIGSLVAQMALNLDMNVIGYDPAISVEAAWRLSKDVEKAENLQALVAKSDYISLHLPLLDSTREMFNQELFANCKKGVKLINYSRGGLVDEKALLTALENDTVSRYLTDFPSPTLMNQPKVVMMPHIGASTKESEDNCARMAASQTIDFLENGNIKNSVNFPNVQLPRSQADHRITISNSNVPKILGSITAVLADFNLNVVDLINKSLDDIAYNIIDVDGELPENLLSTLLALEGVIKVRIL